MGGENICGSPLGLIPCSLSSEVSTTASMIHTEIVVITCYSTRQIEKQRLVQRLGSKPKAKKDSRPRLPMTDFATTPVKQFFFRSA